MITRSYGTPYADSVQGEECWDIVSIDENSQQVGVRHSFRVFFHSRPTLMGGKIESGMTAA